MQPLDGYLYFVEYMGINGRCGFRFQFPKGQPHLSPRGNTEYIYFDHANPLDPLYMPFIIEPPYYPTWELYNPHTATNNSDAWFFGYKWRVSKLEGNDIPPAGQYTELADYRTSGQLGTA